MRVGVDLGHGRAGPGHFLAPIPLFECATKIDPNFAMAYHLLDAAYYKAVWLVGRIGTPEVIASTCRYHACQPLAIVARHLLGIQSGI